MMVVSVSVEDEQDELNVTGFPSALNSIGCQDIKGQI